MIKKTKQELIDMGYTVYSEQEAREIIAEDICYDLVYVRDAIWDVVHNGYKGVNDWTLEDIEDYLVRYTYDDMIAFEWQLEEQP